MTTATRPNGARRGRSAPTGLLFRLAWRNLWRQRRRTLLLIVVVAYATMATIFYWGFADGITQSMLRNQARYLSAPALITTPAYRDDPDPANALPDLDFVARVEADPDVGAAVPRLEFFALLRSPYTSRGAQVRGVVPGLESRVSNVPGAIVEGRMIEGPGEVVLGQDLAADLDVRLGERLVVDVTSVAGPQAAGLELVGLIRSGLAYIDEGSVLVNLEDARRLTGVDTATGVALDVPRGREAAVARRVQEGLPAGLRAYDILALLGPMAQQVETSRAASLWLGLVFGLVGALAVTSTVVVSVLERQREFGMFVAIGMTPPKLAQMVVIEAAVAAALGWLVGLALGYALTTTFSYWNAFGALFGQMMAGFAELGIGDELYTRSSPIYAAYASATIGFAMLLALLIPARRLLKLDPVTAMRAG